jgi:pseudouridine kinase
MPPLDNPQVVVIGAASIDVKGRPLRKAIPATSNPGDIRMSIGGVARNVAENLARLSVPTVLLCAVGDDMLGHQILNQTAAGGVDTSRALLSTTSRSGAYLAILDEYGDMAVSIDDMRICKLLTPQYIRQHRKLLSQADMIVVDTNLSVKTLDAILTIAKKSGVRVCADPVSVELSERLLPRLCDYAIITPNASEAEALLDHSMTVRTVAEAAVAAQRLRACGVQVVVITLGPEGLFYAAENGSGRIPASRVDVVDATGAGDALTAGVVYGLCNGMTLDDAMRVGVSAATLTLLSSETVSPDMSLDHVYERMVI